MIIVPAGAKEGADVSFYQEPMNWDKYPFDWVILRVGQGGWADKSFMKNYKDARARGLRIGAYWFYDGRFHPESQAELFLALTKGCVFEIGVFIDWERVYNGAYEGIHNVVKWMKEVERVAYGCGVYTGYYFFLEHTNEVRDAAALSYVAQRPLWLAWYAAPEVVRLPRPWKDWSIWQKEIRVADYGQASKEIDINVLNEKPVSGEEPQMKTVTVKPGYTIRYRNAPNLSGVILGVVSGGDVVEGLLVDGWIKIDHIIKAGVKIVPTSQAYLYYEPTWFATDVDTPPPSEGLVADHTHTHEIVVNGVTWVGTYSANGVKYTRK